MKTIGFWPVYVGGANSRPKKESKDEKIARLENENEELRAEIKRLSNLVNSGGSTKRIY